MGDLEFDGDIENRSWSGGMARSLSLFEVTFMPWAFDSQIRPYRQIYHQVPVSKSSFFLQCTMKIWINYFLSMLPCDPQLSKEEGEPGFSCPSCQVCLHHKPSGRYWTVNCMVMFSKWYHECFRNLVDFCFLIYEKSTFNSKYLDDDVIENSS